MTKTTHIESYSVVSLPASDDSLWFDGSFPHSEGILEGITVRQADDEDADVEIHFTYTDIGTEDNSSESTSIQVHLLFAEDEAIPQMQEDLAEDRHWADGRLETSRVLADGRVLGVYIYAVED